MVIIKCETILPADSFATVWTQLVKMAVCGVILLPPGFTLLNEVPPDTEIVVIKQKEEPEA